MKTLKYIFASILLSGIFFHLTAQQSINPNGEWGEAGIFLKLTDDLSLIKSGGFEIYRIKNGSGTLLGKVNPPNDKSEFQKRLKYFIRFLPDFKIPRQKMIERIWRQYENNKTLDSLYYWGTTPVVQLAIGAMFLDSTAEKGKTYSYLLKYKDANGNVSEKKSAKVASQEKAIIGDIRFERSRMEEKYLTVSFSAKPVYPSAVQVLRRERTDKPFEKISPLVGLNENNGTLNILILDGAVDSGSVYQYYLTPVNRFNLVGNNSDTVLVGVYDFSKAFLPGRITAESADSVRGIKLSWDSVYYPFVKGIIVERSEIFDSLFVQIAELPLTQTVFIDYNAEPMKKYFYRIKLKGILNEETPYSVRVFGMYEDKTAPLKPFAVKGKGIEKGVELSWVGAEPFLKGFYVYRNNGVDKNLKLISGLIPAKDSVSVYRDTSSELQAGFTYAYSVIAENTSHIKSPFSDAVYVYPLLKEKLIPPTNLKAFIEGNGVQLYWDDMRLINRTVVGYTIYKKEISSASENSALVRIDTMLLPESNNYFDENIGTGKSFQYFVKSHGINESVSELSSGVTVKRETAQPQPPANVTAFSTQKGIFVKWDKPADGNIAKFILYRFMRGEKAIKIVEMKYDESNEFLDASAKKGKLYFYYVVSVDKQNVESRAGKEVGAIIE